MHFNPMHEPSTVFTTGETFHSQMREVRQHGSIRSTPFSFAVPKVCRPF